MVIRRILKYILKIDDNLKDRYLEYFEISNASQKKV